VKEGSKKKISVLSMFGNDISMRDKDGKIDEKKDDEISPIKIETPITVKPEVEDNIKVDELIINT
jgi:hypothetical protein